jgi:hypothetical protein
MTGRRVRRQRKEHSAEGRRCAVTEILNSTAWQRSNETGVCGSVAAGVPEVGAGCGCAGGCGAVHGHHAGAEPSCGCSTPVTKRQTLAWHPLMSWGCPVPDCTAAHHRRSHFVLFLSCVHWSSHLTTAGWEEPCFAKFTDTAAMWSALQKLYGRRFKNADFWETLAKAREAVRRILFSLRTAVQNGPPGRWLVSGL